MQVSTLHEDTHNFFMYSDASRVKFDCVLIQNDNVIAYASRKHKIEKKNYPTHDLELTDVVFASQVWCHYLNGVHIDVFTDKKRL